MGSRQALLESVISPAHFKAAQAEHQTFTAFTQRIGIEESSDALLLYLTYVLNVDHLAGKAIRRKLALLDFAQRLAGEPEWKSNPDVRSYLRGLHRDHAIGPKGEHSDPLYRETLHAMIDAIMLPTHDQLRDRAVILVANETLWPAAALVRLRWRDLRFYGNRIELHLPPPRRPQTRYLEHLTLHARDDDLCAVTALRRLRPSLVPRDQFVFASRRGTCDRRAVETMVARLPSRPGPQYPVRFRTGGTPLRRIVADATATWPLQHRNRALLLISYGAALRGYQVMALRQSQVSVTAAGLVLDVPGRPHLVGVPACEQREYCPVLAWTEWLRTLRAQGHQDPNAPAFLQGCNRVLWPVAVTHESLTSIVSQAAEAAQLTGHYTFTSLRVGFVRTAIRDGTANYVVAAHAGYRFLHTVLRHERREQLIRTSVAGQVGL